MGRDVLKVDWKKAAKAALSEEGESWDYWRWQVTAKRCRTYKLLHDLHRMRADKWEWQYYLRQLRPNFGAAHLVWGLKKKDFTDLQPF